MAGFVATSNPGNFHLKKKLQIEKKNNVPPKNFHKIPSHRCT